MSTTPIAKKKQPRKKRIKARRSAQPAKYTVAQAFDYFYGPRSRGEHDALNHERGIRAVAFLLTYCSEIGNEMIDGNATNGLARILEFCATRNAHNAPVLR